MTYTPNAPAIFIAAYASAMAGMGISAPTSINVLSIAKTPIIPGTPDYTTIAAAAGAWAQQFDTTWGGVRPVSDLDITMTEEACEAVWYNRNTPPPKNVQPSAFTVEVNAIIAAITSAETYFTANGIPQDGTSGVVTLNGDVTGASDANTVVAIQNVSVPVPPNSGTTVLTDNDGVLTWQSVSGGVAWADDLAGSSNSNQWVGSISGPGGAGGTVGIHTNVFQWSNSFPSPTLDVAPFPNANPGTDVSANTFTIAAQVGGNALSGNTAGGAGSPMTISAGAGGDATGSGLGGTGGNLTIRAGSGGNSGTTPGSTGGNLSLLAGHSPDEFGIDGNVIIQAGGTGSFFGAPASITMIGNGASGSHGLISILAGNVGDIPNHIQLGNVNGIAIDVFEDTSIQLNSGVSVFSASSITLGDSPTIPINIPGFINLFSGGSHAASVGALRLANAIGIYARNAANTLDIQLIDIDSSNNVNIGCSENPSVVIANDPSGPSIQLGATGGESSVTVPSLTGSGTRPVQCTSTGLLIPGTAVSGSGSLCMPGTIAVPPTIAGGGWSGFNNGGTATTAADVTLGSSTGIFFNVAATATNGNGYVRAGSNSATMSVEVATGMTNDAALGPTSIQALFSGAMMVEIATSKWVQLVVESASVADSEQADYTGLLFRGSNISAVQSVKNFLSMVATFRTTHLVRPKSPRTGFRRQSKLEDGL